MCVCVFFLNVFIFFYIFLSLIRHHAPPMPMPLHCWPPPSAQTINICPLCKSGTPNPCSSARPRDCFKRQPSRWKQSSGGDGTAVATFSNRAARTQGALGVSISGTMFGQLFFPSQSSFPGPCFQLCRGWIRNGVLEGILCPLPARPDGPAPFGCPVNIAKTLPSSSGQHLPPPVYGELLSKRCCFGRGIMSFGVQCS